MKAAGLSPSFLENWTANVLAETPAKNVSFFGGAPTTNTGALKEAEMAKFLNNATGLNAGSVDKIITKLGEGDTISLSKLQELSVDKTLTGGERKAVKSLIEQHKGVAVNGEIDSAALKGSLQKIGSAERLGMKPKLLESEIQIIHERLAESLAKNSTKIEKFSSDIQDLSSKAVDFFKAKAAGTLDVLLKEKGITGDNATLFKQMLEKSIGSVDIGAMAAKQAKETMAAISTPRS